MGMVRGPYIGTTCVSKLGELEGVVIFLVSEYLNIELLLTSHAKANGFAKVMGRVFVPLTYGLIGLRLADHILMMTTPVMTAV